MLAYGKRHAARIDGIVFKSVDRATRNTEDLARLEALWDRHQIDVFIVDGDLRMSDLGNSLVIGIQGLMARHVNLENARKVAEARERLHREGRMGHKAPYGYQNYRIGRQAYVRIHQENGPKVRRIFELYAYENISVRDLIKRLAAEGIGYTDRYPRFNSSKLYKILMDRTYIGEIPTQHGWLPGVHDPLVDELTFARVQARLGQRHYTKNDIPSRMRAALSRIEKQQDTLFRMRLSEVEEITQEEFALQRERLRNEKLSIEKELAHETVDHDEKCDAAVKAFELADRLAATWVTAMCLLAE